MHKLKDSGKDWKKKPISVVLKSDFEILHYNVKHKIALGEVWIYHNS